MSSLRQVSFLFLLSMNLVSELGHAADRYLCVAENSAGIAFDKTSERWTATVFKADQKVIVAKATDDEKKKAKGATWTVKPIGSDLPESICENDFNDAGYLYCTGFVDFKLNRKNLRYLSIYTIGYITDVQGETNSLFGKEGSNTPAITAGKCSPI